MEFFLKLTICLYEVIGIHIHIIHQRKPFITSPEIFFRIILRGLLLKGIHRAIFSRILLSRFAARYPLRFKQRLSVWLCMLWKMGVNHPND